MILAIETSCDDTCAAVLAPDGEIRANVISSQGIHDRYGGVVPEVASRHHLELANAAVDDRLRRQGIATALLDRLFEVADRPNEQYTLEVRTSNDAAIRLYEGFGFRAAGRRRAYYHDNREDALIMWRTVPERQTA